MPLRKIALRAGLVTLLLVLELSVFAFVISGCEKTPVTVLAQQEHTVSYTSCEMTESQLPVSASDFSKTYAGRSFYSDGNHLGYDILLAENTLIYPIGCGIIRVFRAATGYGRLAVVLEHTLPRVVYVTNGEGKAVGISKFLSIYGHLRNYWENYGESDVMQYEPGLYMGLNDALGAIDNGLTNGDGAEHLHLGIRLQSFQDAQAADKNWFRGYDGIPSQKKWYADPVTFLTEISEALGHACVPGDVDQPIPVPTSKPESRPQPTTDVPIGLVHFVYEGPLMDGHHELHGSWDLPGSASVPWGPESTVQCPDTAIDDGRLDCQLAMPSGTTNFYFTVKLPDGSWWGDFSSNSSGGSGATIGAVTLTGPYGDISYEMKNNGLGEQYFNGHVAVIP